MRSADWFDAPGLDGFLHRVALKAQGQPEGAFMGRPVIGICNTWTELAHCNSHLRLLARDVREGVLRAGGFPLEFPAMGLGELLMKPTTMLYRNLLAMEVEESIRSYPLDAVVALTGCDKTTPAALMGIASADVPALVVTGGPMSNARWRGQVLGSCSDCRRLYADLRGGAISAEEFAEVEDAIARSPGHCMTMGTASTMACLTETLGMTLTEGAAIPAADSRRRALARLAGERAVQLAKDGLRPSAILTPAAFDNAIRVLQALGGSTNAVIHLLALAGRAGVDLSLARFDELGREVPVLVNLKPSGEHLMEDFFFAGGMPALHRELRDVLDCSTRTVESTLADSIARARPVDSAVIRPRSDPVRPTGALAVLRGSLCPDGAVIKISAADEHRLSHRGRAVVFESAEDLHRRIDDPDLEVDADSVLVLRNCGPVGGPGMPEAGNLPIPEKLLKAGVRDMVRISDARMSGTASGTVVLHVAPEAAVGGPLSRVRDGDMISLDVPSRRLDLEVDEAVLSRREPSSAPATASRGYKSIYIRTVQQADRGCDLDFLRGVN